ncbi:MAG: alpha/beta fold hydrolase [Anaerolineales bacterium]
MKSSSWALLAIGLVFVLLSLSQIVSAGNDLEIIKIPGSDPPTTIVAPSEAAGDLRPVVLVGHGFAGSELLMRGFSFSLAKAGYIVVAWDFDGHGRNPRPYLQDGTMDALLANAEAALETARTHSFVTSDRVAILGHSMGSGVALSFGIKHPETAATIAISPVPRPVTPSLPNNLLLMAGDLEPQFVENAEQLLADAGGAGGDPAQGNARELRVISGVEHISILFKADSYAVARHWLDDTFGQQPDAVDYRDRRMSWYGLGIVGVLLLGWALTPFLDQASNTQRTPLPLWRRLFVPVGGALGASILLWILNVLGVRLDAPLGLVVGGYVLIWLGLAGLISLILLGFRLSPLSTRLLLSGSAAFAILWLGVGILSNFVWIPWLIIPKRLILWPVGALLTLPWFLAIGETLRGEGFLQRFAGWIGNSILLAVGFVLSMRLIPGLYVLILVLPLLPLILGLVELAAARLRGSWPFAICGALFLSWTLLAVFPLT